MSGAFNIDVEVGPDDQTKNNQKVKVYCASLTEAWTVSRTPAEMNVFRRELMNEERVRKHKITIPALDAADVASAELFLSQLGCTAAVLRVPSFHEFLAIPDHVRGGLSYASHKPFGKTIREGYLQKHPRYVRKNVGKRWIRLTRDERGGSLVSYLDESKKIVLASFKIGASTEVKSISDKVKDAFVVKSGKRQWVLQSSGTREYTTWTNDIFEVLKQFNNNDPNANANNASSAGKNNNYNQNANASPVAGRGASPRNQNNNNNKNNNKGSNVEMGGGGSNAQLEKENGELRVKLDRMQGIVDRLQSQLTESNEDRKEEDDNESDGHIRKMQKKHQKIQDDLIRDYELQHENLRSEIEDLHRQLEAKTAMEAGSSGLKTMFADGFGLGVDADDLQVEIDTEKRYLDTLTEDEKQSIKFVHKHLHRHDHKHIHHHRHEHIHDEERNLHESQTHTISHTITHTNTQFKMKRSFF